MKLLELRANNKGFHTIKFNKQGISLIVAKKRTENGKNTYNSVGKSLSISLIHFCLASSKIPAFEEKLKGWIFYLDFEINDIQYTSCRSADQQNDIYLNEEKMSLIDFKNKLGEEVFNIKQSIKNLSFRNLISRFIRPSRGSYNSYDKYIPREEEYSQLLNTSYLLGLDVNRIEKKCNMKEELDQVKDLGYKIQKDPTMKTFFLKDSANENVEIKIVELEKKISELQHNIDTFEIADDYDQIKKEADALSASLKDYRNQATKLHLAISNIDKSLQLHPDITRQKILSFYDEAQVQISDMVVRKLEDLETFNSKLLNNRTDNLLQEKQRFESLLAETEQKIKNIGDQENKKMQYLNSHGALDDYTQLTKLLSDYKLKLSELEEYKRLIKEYKTKQEEIKKEFANENINTAKYLEKIEVLIKKNILIFQSLTEQFYEKKSSGITIENNEGKNKLRFNIKARIMDDTGDGVNEVRIFCFDWTLLKGQYNHCVKFIFHDSRIVSENDPRQVATMLKIAQYECAQNGFQYILSINQSTLTTLEDELTPEQYKSLIVDNEILELNDLSDKNKLLGMQIDLNYARE